MPIYEVTFTECCEIEAENEEKAIELARENVHIYAEDDAYYDVELIEE